VDPFARNERGGRLADFVHQKPKILLAYISSALENTFVKEVEKNGFEVRAFHFRDLNSIRDAARWANAIFIQWDGRGQTAHTLLLGFQTGGPNAVSNATIYALTLSTLKIETLNERMSQQLNIFRWFDLPNQIDALHQELSVLIPDVFDSFHSDVENCGLHFISEVPLKSLGGKHLVETIKSAWEARRFHAEHVTRIKDETRRCHITVFHPSEERVAEIKNILTSVDFRYSDGFSDMVSCTRWFRGHGTDCLIVWCDARSHEVETVIRLYTESRTFSRIPMVMLYSSEEALNAFKTRAPDLFVDRFILFDRHREKFGNAIFEVLSQFESERGPRRLLDELRTTSLDFPSPASKPLTVEEVSAACDAIGLDKSKSYWVDAERALADVRFGSRSGIKSELELKYGTFDALLIDTSTRCSHSIAEAQSATYNFVQKLMWLSDFNFERLVRSAILLTRSGCPDSLRDLLNQWWMARDRYPATHEFYWAASRWAQQTGAIGLERVLLGMAIELEPLRNETVEAYANHLLATGHIKQVAQLGEFLSKSRYFPIKKAQMILFNVLVKIGDKDAASAILAQMIARSPADRSLIKLKAKLV
jgi:hypothetical protein